MDTSKFNIKKEWRKFGIGLGIILAVIATVQFLMHKPFFYYLYVVAVAAVLIALTAPILLKPIFIVFSYLGFAIGWVMTRVILSALYFLFITPAGFFSRLFGKEYLDMDFHTDSESYWKIRENPAIEKEEFERQF